MAYVAVPKDLSKVKTKVAFNLTMRQIICFSIAAVFGIPVYFFTKSYLGVDVAAFLMVIIMLPFFFLAMYEKDGFPAEKILFHIIRKKFFYPEIRVYQTKNTYWKLANMEDENIAVKKTKKASNR